MDIKKIISIINDLPVEQRAELATQLLQGLTVPDPNIEQAWMCEVERRAREVDSGEVEMIPGDQVMPRLRSVTLG